MSRARVLLWVALVALGAGGAGCSRTATPIEIRRWDAEIARLQAEHDSLDARATNMFRQDPTILAIPQGDIVLGVPTEFVQAAVERILTDVVSRVTLRLSGIRAHVEKKVKKVVTLGTAVVDIEVTEIVGSLRPGTPALAFAGNQLSIALPVEVVEGRGSASIHLDWDGKNVAQLACGDLDKTLTVTGNVIPMSTELHGMVSIALEGEHVVARPRFPAKLLRLYIEPSAKSWAAVQSILDEKKGLCAFILKKVDLKQSLYELVRTRGIKVTLHLERLKPFRIPISVSTAVPTKAGQVPVQTRARSLRVDPERIWFAADVVAVAADSSVAAAGPSTR